MHLSERCSAQQRNYQLAAEIPSERLNKCCGLSSQALVVTALCAVVIVCGSQIACARFGYMHECVMVQINLGIFEEHTSNTLAYAHLSIYKHTNIYNQTSYMAVTTRFMSSFPVIFLSTTRTTTHQLPTHIVHLLLPTHEKGMFECGRPTGSFLETLAKPPPESSCEVKTTEQFRHPHCICVRHSVLDVLSD